MNSHLCVTSLNHTTLWGRQWRLTPLKRKIRDKQQGSERLHNVPLVPQTAHGRTRNRKMQLPDPKLATGSSPSPGISHFIPSSVLEYRIRPWDALSWALSQLEITASSGQEALKSYFPGYPLIHPGKFLNSRLPMPTILPPRYAQRAN